MIVIFAVMYLKSFKGSEVLYCERGKSVINLICVFFKILGMFFLGIFFYIFIFLFLYFFIFLKYFWFLVGFMMFNFMLSLCKFFIVKIKFVIFLFCEIFFIYMRFNVLLMVLFFFLKNVLVIG